MAGEALQNGLMDTSLISDSRLAEIQLLIDDQPVQALVFALPVVQLTEHGEGLPAQLDDIDDICRQLHGAGGMGTDSQGLYVLPRLLSSAMLASLSPRRRQSLLAGLMIDDCERVALGDLPRLEAHVDLDSDEASPLPLRFLVGCVYRFDAREPLHLATADQWEHEGLRAKVEGAMGLALGGSSDGMLSVARVATVLPPLPMEDALSEGLVELIRQSLRTCSAESCPEVRLLDGGDVELRLVSSDQVLSMRLSSELMGTPRIESILYRTHVLLGGTTGTDWRSGASAH